MQEIFRIGLSECREMQTTGCGLHFFVKKIGATGCVFDFQGVGYSKLQGVVCIFLKKNRRYRVYLGHSECLGIQTTGCGLHFLLKN